MIENYLKAVVAVSPIFLASVVITAILRLCGTRLKGFWRQFIALIVGYLLLLGAMVFAGYLALTWSVIHQSVNIAGVGIVASMVSAIVVLIKYRHQLGGPRLD